MSIQKNLTFKEYVKALVTKQTSKTHETKYSAILEFMTLQDEGVKAKYQRFIGK